MNLFIKILFSIPAVLIATTVHEFTRAMTSIALGDDLPKNLGRNTLNPVKHFEPIGFLLLLYSNGFGWGQPVETSSIRYKNRKRDVLLVAILPSVANLLVGALAIFIYTKFGHNLNSSLAAILVYTSVYNIGIAVYNCVPVVPMDCAKALSVLLPSNRYYQYLQQEKMIQMIFLFLLFFGITNNIFGPIINMIIGFIESFFLIF